MNALRRSIWGIPIRIHFLLLLYPILHIVSYGMQAGLTGCIVALLVSTTLYVTVLVHELGHALMTRRVGGECSSILLWPLGGLAYCGHHGNYQEQIYISLAGPLTHVPQFIFWLLVQICGTGGGMYLTTSRLGDKDQVCLCCLCFITRRKPVSFVLVIRIYFATLCKKVVKDRSASGI